MLSKFSKLSRNDKKLIITFAAITLGLIIGVVSAALFTRSRGRDENGYVDFVQENGGVIVQNGGGAAVAPSEDFADFEIAPSAMGRLSIEALSYTEFGVDVGSDFLVSSETQSLSAEHLSEYLTTRDGMGFSLEPSGSNRFLLQLDEEMDANSIVNFVYQPPGFAAVSHAFQTADVFRVVNTSPAVNTFNVPSDAGIEITFNQALMGDLAAFEQHFSIDPPVDGRFFLRGETYIFAPVAMEFNRTYTVTIREGLVGVSGETLAENFVFSFTTAWGTAAASAFSVRQTYETFLPWNEVFVAMNINRDFSHRDFNVRLYELPDVDSFLNFSGVEGAALIEESVITLRTFGEGWDSFHYLFLERTLPEGFYAVDITSAARDISLVAHKLIQVSPLSVYSLSVDGEALFWVHDASTGQPALGARVEVGGTQAATVGADGIAIAATGSDRRANITIHYGGYLPFAYITPTFGARELLPTERFLSYMYTDRPTYRPDDTIDVFGVIKPRYGQAHSEDDVFILRIGDMLQMPITLDAFNSFAVSVPVTNMFGWADIIVEVGGERLMSSWVNFLDYANFSFVVSGSLDRLVYEAGDNVNIEASITTFAGRPAEGIVLRTHNPQIPDMTTNEQGIAGVTLPIVDDASARRDWSPHWASFWYSVVDGGQDSQSITFPHIVIPRDVMLENTLEGDTLTVTTNRIDAAAIEEAKRGTPPWSHIEPDIFRGAAVDVDFEVVITRHVTTQTIRSQQYDHINRRMVTTYDFSTTSDEYRTVHGRTEGGRAVISGFPVSADRLVRYTFIIHFNDTRGRPASSWVTVPWHNLHIQDSTVRHFFFPLAGSRSFSIGETIDVTIVEADEESWWWGLENEATQLTEGRILAVLARDGIIQAAVGDVSGVALTFPEAAVSNAILFGAYFDGQYIFNVSNSMSLLHNYSERELEVELSFCKESYRPGDEVTVQISTDRPAQVLISVVDESAIQNPWHNANFLSRLYRSSMVWEWMMNATRFVSHTQHNFGGAFGGGAEGGGGDDGGDSLGFREFFVDNPVFETVLTVDGSADLTFTLPHQITSWRVTVLALTEDGYAGEAVENIIAALDFYVELLYTNEYIVGDDIAAVVRSFGQGSDEVEYTFSIVSDDELIFSDSIIIANTRNPRAVFNAGQLPAGEYKMQVIAVSGSYSDALERSFTVAEYALIIQNNITGEISEENPHALHPALFNMRPFPVRLTLTNANIRPLMQILNDAANHNSSRTDAIAAAAFRDYFFTGESDSYAVRSRIHNEDGGIPELTYENSNWSYTARFAAAFPEYVEPARIIEFMSQVINDPHTPANRASALYALAAIGEPVLLQIRQEIADLDPTDTLTALQLAAALIAIGDDTAAAALFNQIDTSNAHDTRHRELLDTLTFFINTTINPQAAWLHVTQAEQTRYISDIPERINFVRRTVFLGGTISEFSYTLHAETHYARLENFDRLHLHLTYDQFTDLNLTPTSGETNFHLTFQSYNAANWNPANNRIQITRTITPADNLYRVTFDITFPPDARGLFIIYDRLPSNHRFVPSRHFLSTRPWYSIQHTQRQLIQLHLHANANTPLTRTIHYYALSLHEAASAAGTTLITNHDNSLWGKTE